MSLALTLTTMQTTVTGNEPSPDSDPDYACEVITNALIVDALQGILKVPP